MQYSNRFQCDLNLDWILTHWLLFSCLSSCATKLSNCTVILPFFPSISTSLSLLLKRLTPCLHIFLQWIVSFVTDYQIYNGNGRQPAKVVKDTLSSCNRMKFPWVFHEAEEVVIILVEMIIKRCDLLLQLFQRCHLNLGEWGALKQTWTKPKKIVRAHLYL